MPSHPLVSVVVPFYNVERYLDQCLESLRRQTYQHLEILCIDDRGRDGSLAIANSFASCDPRFTVHSQPDNLGIAEARNTGLRRASGQYIAFIDSDDWVMPDMIETMVDAMRDHDVDSVWIKWVYFLEETGQAMVDMHHHYTHYPEGIITVHMRDLPLYPTVTWNKLYDRQFLIDNDLGWPCGLLYEDNEFFFKCFSLVERVYLLDRYLYVYRKRKNSIMDLANNGQGHSEAMCDIGRNCRRFLEQRGVYPENAGHLLDFIGQQVESFVVCESYKDAIIPALQRLLDDLGFPEGCHESSRYPMFDAIRRYRKDPRIPSITIPMSELRRMIPDDGLRYWLMVYCLNNQGVTYHDEIDFQPFDLQSAFEAYGCEARSGEPFSLAADQM